MQTSIHIRLNEATGKRFVKKLQDMGFSVMPNGKRSYYMHNPSDGRVLVNEEASSDLVIQGFWPKTASSDIVELLEKTARAAAGDMYLDDEAGTEISIVQGIDAPQPSQVAPVQPAPPQTQQQQAQQYQTQQQPVNGVNMDPEFYKKMIMDGAGKLMQMFAMGHMKAEDIYTQATRIQSSAWIMAGLSANFLTPQDVQQLMNDAKQAINDVPQEIQKAQQYYQQRMQQAQQAQQSQQGGVGQTTMQDPDPFATTGPSADPFGF